MSPMDQKFLGVVFHHRLGSVEQSRFYRPVAEGMESQSREYGYPLCFFSNGDEEMAQLWRFHAQGLLDGLILLGADMERSLAESAVQKSIPVVLGDNDLEGLGLDSVVTDNASGMRQIMRHLASLGHERVGFIGGPLSHRSLWARYSVYQQWMAQSSMVPRDEWVWIIDDRRADWAKGRDAMRAMLEGGLDITAVVCDNDHSAAGAVEACREQGVSVPDRLSVVGFDDISRAKACSPPLTTVHVHKEEMGRWLVRRLVERTMNDGVKVTVALDARLIVRDSTGPVPGRAAGR